MAHTNNGCVVLLGANQLPADYEKPAVTKVTDHEYVRTKILTIPKATVHNANPATTLANILANGTVGVNKQVTDLVAADFLTSTTVTVHSELVSLTNTFQNMMAGGAAYTDASVNYVAVVNIYIKSV